MTTQATPAAPVVPPVTEPVVPPAAPATAPVAPPVPAPAPAAEPAPQTETWEASGNQLVDTIAKGYLEKGGTSASFQALLDDVAETGTLTQAARVALRETFGDMADALIPSIELEAKANLEWVTKERKAVYDTAGGEAAFNQMREWAAANLDEKTRGFLSASLELGGTNAQMAVQQLKQLMIDKGATVTDGTHKVDGAPQGNSGYIGLAEYITENAKLQRTGDTAGMAALKARANASMKQAEAKGIKWR